MIKSAEWININTGQFFSNNHVHSSQGGTQEASDSISDYLFRMQFLYYQGWKGKFRRPWSTFRPNTDLDESTASTTNFPRVRNILSLSASHLLVSCFITASYLCESLLLHCIQHRLGRKTVKGKAFLSSQEMQKFHGPHITSEIVFRSNTTYSNLLPFSFFFLVAAFTVKKFLHLTMKSNLPEGQGTPYNHKLKTYKLERSHQRQRNVERYWDLGSCVIPSRGNGHFWEGWKTQDWLTYLPPWKLCDLGKMTSPLWCLFFIL